MFQVPLNYKKPHPFGIETEGNNGHFIVPHHKIAQYYYVVMASDGMGWEHVSITLSARSKPSSSKLSGVDRCPTWSEMCFIKDLFWDDTDCVVQFHPPRSEYVSNHPYCLHLWRSTNAVFPAPPSIMVGLKSIVNNEEYEQYPKSPGFM